MIKGIVRAARSPRFFLWQMAAFVLEAPTRWRIIRLAATGIRFNRWRMRLASLGEDSLIYPSVIIHAADQVSVGSNVAIAEFVHIWGGGGVSIGNDTMIASHVIITSQTHATSPNERRTNVHAAVNIGRNVWIGAGAIILPGVSIGDGAIVAAGAVVTSSVPEGTTVVGIPARPLQ